METARRKLIDGAGRKDDGLKPRWGAADRFSPAATLRQAQRDVREAHRQRIERIDEFERGQLSTIVEQSRRENRLQGTARDDFNQMADRRHSSERRRVRPREH